MGGFWQTNNTNTQTAFFDNVTVTSTGLVVPVTPSNPTSNSPQCSNVGVTLTASGTPPIDETWYWQTTALGTSTTNPDPTNIVTSSGTYYLRARNNNSLCWSSSSGSIAVIVNPVPATPGAISEKSPTATGPVCPNIPNLVYSISAVPNATTYNWSVPAGWTITAGQGTTSIIVTSGAVGDNGNITVTAENTCGISTARTAAVSIISAFNDIGFIDVQYKFT